jgi:hypothetical protein
MMRMVMMDKAVPPFRFPYLTLPTSLFARSTYPDGVILETPSRGERGGSRQRPRGYRAGLSLTAPALPGAMFQLPVWAISSLTRKRKGNPRAAEHLAKARAVRELPFVRAKSGSEAA